MQRKLSIATLCTSLFAVLLFLSGCAGGVVKTTGGNSSNPPLDPGNPPLSPGNSPYGATLQYHAELIEPSFGPNNTPVDGGPVSIDTSGKTTVEIGGASPNTTYSVQFCPAFLSGTIRQPCLTIGSLPTNASGAGTVVIQFPKAGSWAGDFELFSSTNPGPNPDYVTAVEPTTSFPLAFSATMQPLNTVNGGTLVIPSVPMTQSPLTSGTVTYSMGTVQFTLTGGVPDSLYRPAQCDDYGTNDFCTVLGNSQGQSSFQTDARGDVTFSVFGDNAADLFTVDPQNGQAGYIGGFLVP